MFAMYRIRCPNALFFINLNHESVIWKKRMFFGGTSSKVLTVVLWESRAWNFVLVSCSFKAYMILRVTQGSIYLTWCDDGYYLEYLASENFVLASESNLSLATGLASWKVSLEPWLCLFFFFVLTSTSKLYAR